MNLEITPDLVRELYDRVKMSRRPAETGVVLTADGWDVDVWPERSPWPVAITGEDVHALLDGDEPDSGEGLEESIVEMLTVPEPAEGTRFVVLDEEGDESTALRGAQVVTCRLNGHGADAPGTVTEDLAWPEAWWFDQDAARRVLASAWPTDSYGRSFSLWETVGGRYVALRTSSCDGEPGESWVELGTEQAAMWIYGAHAEDLDDDLTDATGRPGQSAPPLMVAARALREAADAVTVPAVPTIDIGYGLLDRRPGAVEDEALHVQETAAVLAALARNVVAPELTDKRRAAVRILVEANGGQSGAARRMGVSQPTVNNLIK